jgi:glycerophosphoryl diester phosphodiesterase
MPQRSRASRPQVVAHRGSSDARAEHTLAAYRQAVSEGADALECDVRLTADGHLVCLHDRRVERTSDGHGVVSSLELSELHDLDFASWKGTGNEAPDVDEESRRVLTLERLLDTVAGADRSVELAVETKHPTRYAGLVEERLVDLVREFGWHRAGSPVRVMSFSGVALMRVERMAPELQVVLLIEGVSWKVARAVLAPGWIAGPGIDELRAKPRLGGRLRKAGHRIVVWTVNTEDDLDFCVDLGVEAVITDRPDHLRSLLGASSADRS